MKKYRIIVSQSIDRIYEVDANDKEQALDIYFEYDHRTKFVEEKEVPEMDAQIEVEEKEE